MGTPMCSYLNHKLLMLMRYIMVSAGGPPNLHWELEMGLDSDAVVMIPTLTTMVVNGCLQLHLTAKMLCLLMVMRTRNQV